MKEVKSLVIVMILLLVSLFLIALALVLGNTWYPLGQVVGILMGDTSLPGNFAILEVRLPRALIGALTGFAFGLGGVTFQTLLRNNLASPDIIGISSGSSLAAVFAILVLHLSGPGVSILSILAGLGLSAAMVAIAQWGHFSGGRLILIGIGFSALSQAGINIMLLGAHEYDIPAAMRWLNGSLNGLRLYQVGPVALLTLLGSGIILTMGRAMVILELGDEAATSLGLHVGRYRLVLVVVAVILIAMATSLTGPIAFVSFLAGPLARGMVGSTRHRFLASGLLGAILVLGADMVGQYALETRYPVGIITGIIGAPYLVALLIKLHKKDGSS